MTHEIVYTSVPSGLRGSSGYTTVAASDGIPENIWTHLEKLTGYEHLFNAKSAQARLNPVAYVHYTSTIGGKRLHIFGRISNAELDYTGRSNLIAHLVAAGERELKGVDNSAKVLQRIKWISSWPVRGEPRKITEREQVKIQTGGAAAPSRCEQWGNFTGHPGWGGVLAESYLNRKYRQAAIIIPKQFIKDGGRAEDLLDLVSESLNLLPPRKRQEVNFSTYFTDNLPQSIRCHWVFVAQGTDVATQAQRDPRILTIDLSADLGTPPASDYVDVATSGGTLPWEAKSRNLDDDAEELTDADFYEDSSSELPPVHEEPTYIPVNKRKQRKGSVTPKRSKKSSASWLSKLTNFSEIKENPLVPAVVAVVVLLCVTLISIKLISGPDEGAANDVPPGEIYAPANQTQFEETNQFQRAPAVDRRQNIPQYQEYPEDSNSEEERSEDIPKVAGVNRNQEQRNSQTAKHSNNQFQPEMKNEPQTQPGAFELASVDKNALPPKTNNNAPAELTNKPFDIIRQQNNRFNLAIPKRASFTSQSTSSTDEGTVTLKLRPETNVDIKILAAEEITGENGREFVVKSPVENNGKLEYQVIRTGKTSFKDYKVGTFHIADQQLSFEWDSNAGDKEFQMRDCLLKLKSDSPADEVYCALRNPKVLSSVKLEDFTGFRKRIELFTDNANLSSDTKILMEVVWTTSSLNNPLGVRSEDNSPVVANSTGNEGWSRLTITDSSYQFWDETSHDVAAIDAKLEVEGDQVTVVFEKQVNDQWPQEDQNLTRINYPIQLAALGDSQIKTELPRAIKSVETDMDRRISNANTNIENMTRNIDKLIKQRDQTDNQNQKQNFNDQIDRFNKNIEKSKQRRQRLQEAKNRNKSRLERVIAIDESVRKVANSTQVHLRIYRQLQSFKNTDVLVLLETEGFPR